jgi:hypothetical protein
VSGRAQVWSRRGSRWLAGVAVAVAAAVLVLGLGGARARAACFAEGPSDSTAPTLSPTGYGPAIKLLSVTEGTWVPISGSCDTQVGSVTYDFYRNTTTGKDRAEAEPSRGVREAQGTTRPSLPT